ncbi:trans-2,3-dihydro-3-hydroxyanthranilate isomerase [Methylopila capsulata]|uniref:Isomerase n=1 Tax=Methylopila capsulata TaxID=61654 RepID=A0A9W6IY44_9HYPH|nr:PhzF family phenazine biosynthesis protein [Methylopila capsulata]MBM7853344.1 trans-2,3-dihydro-3-hydroxyanthranilate isomerase [Methylopila capsulata]GLK57440.1 isomerase [Methylopila capsulata]
MARRYVILDVFTDRAYAGNPLAAVLDTEGLDAAGMQMIAREFNLSETVFLLPAEVDGRKARLRIFMPHKELPFAGHPTVGAAVLLGLLTGVGSKEEGAFEVEEAVGVISCRVRLANRTSGRASFTLPRLPEPAGEPPTVAQAAAALGISPDEIGFDGHSVSRFSAGNPFTFVPVKNADAVARVAANGVLWPEAFGDDRNSAVFVYTRETVDSANTYHARMLEPAITEDPATGSAAAAFTGVVAAFDRPGEGSHAVRIEQGYEMGRPSLIEVGLEIAGGTLASATVGGGAVVVAEGTLLG